MCDECHAIVIADKEEEDKFIKCHSYAIRERYKGDPTTHIRVLSKALDLANEEYSNLEHKMAEAELARIEAFEEKSIEKMDKEIEVIIEAFKKLEACRDNFESLIIKVYFSEASGPIIVGIWGDVGTSALHVIENELDDEDFSNGDGEYQFKVHLNKNATLGVDSLVDYFEIIHFKNEKEIADADS